MTCWLRRLPSKRWKRAEQARLSTSHRMLSVFVVESLTETINLERSGEAFWEAARAVWRQVLCGSSLCGVELMTKPSMLVVEDNPLSRATATGMFEELGFTVFDTYNGHHALALIEARPEIKLMFVDVRMPGMSGSDLAEVVRRRRPDIKLILTSGYVGEEAVPPGLSFVPKPWRVDQIARAVAPDL